MSSSKTSELEVEITSLARTLAAKRGELIEFYIGHHHLTPQQAAAKASEWTKEEWEMRIQSRSTELVTWFHLDALAEADPVKMVEMWNRMKQIAQGELQHGKVVARSVTGRFGSPSERAEFAAIFDAFRGQWQPVSSGETLLIQMLAQQFMGYLYWSEFLQTRATSDAKIEPGAELNRAGRWKPLRVSSAQTLEFAATMQERYHRLFTRTLRTIRDLPRFAPSVTINNPSMVNIAAQQQNTQVQVPDDNPNRLTEAQGDL